MRVDLSELQEPWHAIDGNGDGLVVELKSEMSASHILFGKQVHAIARRFDCDDVLFRFDGQLAVVHLTYNGQEKDSLWPQTDVYQSWDNFVVKRMMPDANEFQTGDT